MSQPDTTTHQWPTDPASVAWHQEQADAVGRTLEQWYADSDAIDREMAERAADYVEPVAYWSSYTPGADSYEFWQASADDCAEL